MRSQIVIQIIKLRIILCFFTLIFASIETFGKMPRTFPAQVSSENDSIWQLAPIYSDLTDALAAQSAGNRVLRLNLSRNKLRIVPPELAQLTDLKELILDRTKIATLPFALEKLERLEHFSANGNEISEFPEVILSWRNLEYLSLGNNIIDSIPLDIDLLGELRTLNLWSNLIAFFPASLGDLSQLISIDLTTNDMTEEEQLQLKSWMSPSTKLLLSAPCRCEFKE
jgi:Leucine-rich repeat (LRR) protein